MTLNPVLLGRAEIMALEGLRNLAVAHTVFMPELNQALKTDSGKRRHMKQMSTQTVHIPLDYYVTLSLETGHPVGTCRHMSMSSGRPGHLPIPEAVWMIAENLGFVGSLQFCTVWLEDLKRPGGPAKAVNLLQPVGVTESGQHLNKWT